MKKLDCLGYSIGGLALETVVLQNLQEAEMTKDENNTRVPRTAVFRAVGVMVVLDLFETADNWSEIFSSNVCQSVLQPSSARLNLEESVRAVDRGEVPVTLQFQT